MALGFGSQMKGALMFVAYAAQSTAPGGFDITLSPRLGTGHAQPKYDSSIDIKLLKGSGIINGTYVVNAQCTNCRTWKGGSLNVKSTDQPMIYAFGDTDENVKSNDKNATIQQHEVNGNFKINMVQATGNPGVPVNVNRATGTTGGETTVDSRLSIQLHAIFMVGSFVVLFPLGAVVLRVFEKVVLHYVNQTFGALCVLIGFGLGIHISLRYGVSLPKLTYLSKL